MSGEGMPLGIHGVPCTPNVAFSVVQLMQGIDNFLSGLHTVSIVL